MPPVVKVLKMTTAPDTPDPLLGGLPRVALKTVDASLLADGDPTPGFRGLNEFPALPADDAVGLALAVDGQGRVLVLHQQDGTLRLMTPEAELKLIPESEIEERARGASAMPQDLIQQLSLRELRDLVDRGDLDEAVGTEVPLHGLAAVEVHRQAGQPLVPVLAEDGQGDAPVASEIALAEPAFLRRKHEPVATKPQVPSADRVRRAVG